MIPLIKGVVQRNSNLCKFVTANATGGYGLSVEVRRIHETRGKPVGNPWETRGKPVGNPWETRGKIRGSLRSNTES
jgi:hypothetical protein